VFGFYQFTSEVSFVEGSEKYGDSEVWEFSCELYFVVAVAALFAVEGSEHEFPEEGDFGEQDGGFAVFFAVGAETFDYSGWV